MRAALGVAVTLAAVGAAALLAAGRVLVVADPLPPRADAIVILAGSVPDRALAAADLYRAGLAPRVVVTRERAGTGQAALHARGVRLPEDAELAQLEHAVDADLGALAVHRPVLAGVRLPARPADEQVLVHQR